MRQGKESPVSDNFSHHDINLKGKTSNPSSYVLGFRGNLENFGKKEKKSQTNYTSHWLVNS